jgi:hypothetical protein
VRDHKVATAKPVARAGRADCLQGNPRCMGGERGDEQRVVVRDMRMGVTLLPWRGLSQVAVPRDLQPDLITSSAGALYDASGRGCIARTSDALGLAELASARIRPLFLSRTSAAGGFSQRAEGATSASTASGPAAGRPWSARRLSTGSCGPGRSSARCVGPETGPEGKPYGVGHICSESTGEHSEEGLAAPPSPATCCANQVAAAFASFVSVYTHRCRQR